MLGSGIWSQLQGVTSCVQTVPVGTPPQVGRDRDDHFGSSDIDTEADPKHRDETHAPDHATVGNLKPMGFASIKSTTCRIPSATTMPAFSATLPNRFPLSS